MNEAQQLATALAQKQQRVVFAESCTGGLVAATLAQVPGISNALCGSAVTYREGTKQAWLKITADDLARYTAESETIARQMAMNVLDQTPEANIAASVVGHLGPHAPADLDGIIYVGLAKRLDNQPVFISTLRHQLDSTERVARQHEATNVVLRQVSHAVNTS